MLIMKEHVLCIGTLPADNIADDYNAAKIDFERKTLHTGYSVFSTVIILFCVNCHFSSIMEK